MRIVISLAEAVWIIAVVVCIIIELCKAAIRWLKGKTNGSR